MALGHSDGFRVDRVTHRAAQAAAIGKRFIRHFGPPLVLDGAATICIFMQILSAAHTGDFIDYERYKGLSNLFSRSFFATIFVLFGAAAGLFVPVISRRRSGLNLPPKRTHSERLIPLKTGFAG
jgi:hypothetical protein